VGDSNCETVGGFPFREEGLQGGEVGIGIESRGAADNDVIGSAADNVIRACAADEDGSAGSGGDGVGRAAANEDISEAIAAERVAVVAAKDVIDTGDAGGSGGCSGGEVDGDRRVVSLVIQPILRSPAAIDFAGKLRIRRKTECVLALAARDISEVRKAIHLVEVAGIDAGDVERIRSGGTNDCVASAAADEQSD
jgi:hypothetical protein